MDAGIPTRQQLAADLRREDLTLDELVDRAHRLLAELAPTQSRYKVTERPDVRTIRYYVGRKLLPGPVSYEGGRARYSGAHLIRLLWIKKLQAEHHTLRRIARLLDGASDNQVLDQLLPEGRETRIPGDKRARPAGSADGVAPTAPSPPPAPPESTTLERIQLVPGATLDVPRALLGDVERRGELADELERLARSLRRAGEGAGFDPPAEPPTPRGGRRP